MDNHSQYHEKEQDNETATMTNSSKKTDNFLIISGTKKIRPIKFAKINLQASEPIN